jgi:predicted transcriptional regulator
MTLREIKEILGAQVLAGEHMLEREVETTFACDLISDMLAFASSNALIVTSLTNPHVIHTAEVVDAAGVVFVGGKKPPESMMKEVDHGRIPLLSTDLLTFKCCGLLFVNGLKESRRNSDK